MPPITYVSLLVAALLIAAVSKRIRATIITVPMLCVFLGVHFAHDGDDARFDVPVQRHRRHRCAAGGQPGD